MSAGRLRRSSLLAWHWLWLALAIMIAASFVAWRQPGSLPMADRSQENLSLWQTFSRPIETNPHRRLISTRANLTALHMMADGKRGWTAGGGVVLRTDDAGQTWRSGPAELYKPDEQINDLVFLDGDRRGIAVSKSGALFVSNDGGDSWTAHRKVPGGPRFWKSMAFSGDGRFGIAVGDEDGFFITQDRGVSWQQKLTPDKSGNSLYISYRSYRFTVENDGWRIWAANTDNVYRTIDGGATWTPRADLKSLELNAFHVSQDGKHMWAVGKNGIVQSADTGATWILQYRSPYPLEDITFDRDGQRGWAVGAEGHAVRTGDGGRTWQTSPTASLERLNRVAFDRNGIAGIAVGENGTVLVSNSGGQSWCTATAPVLWQVAMDGSADLSHAWIAGAAGIRMTRDAGRHWTFFNAQPFAGRVNAITFNQDGKRGWAATASGAILSTGDGGRIWSPQPTGTTSALESIFFLPDALRGWAIGEGVALATNDGGKSWKAMPSLAGQSFKRLLFSADGIRGWAVSNNAVWGTRDGGLGWERQVDAKGGRMNDLAFDDSGLRGYAIGFGNQLFSTSDGGENWTKRQCAGGCGLLASVTVGADGMRAWAAGVDGVIVYTSDGGVSWSRQSSGVKELLASIRFSRDGLRGLAIGVDNAILSSTDGGATWTPVETYSRLPAPWYWLVVVLAAIPVWLSWHWRPASAARQSVADVGASDAEIREAADDRLEFTGLARGISRFLRNPATSAPLTLAIIGDWGSGKSSLMQLVCTDLRRFDHYPIWFNAWHHQKEEHLFAALLGAIRKQAVPPILSLAGAAFRLRLLWLRSSKHFGIMILLLAGATAMIAINLPLISTLDFGNMVPSIENLAKIAQPIAILFATLVTAIAAINTAAKPFHVDPALLLTTLRDNMSVKTAAAQNDFRDQFAQQFGELTAALPQRLVVVIDDLDRCRPTAVLDVMEAVNYLTSAGQCVVIFGMARERVLASLGLACKDIAAELAMMESTGAAEDHASDPAVARRRSYAADYLQKLINIEITVPSTHDRPLHELLIAPASAPRRAVLDSFALFWKLWPVAAASAAIVAGLCLARLMPSGVAGAASSALVLAQPTSSPPLAVAAPLPQLSAPLPQEPNQVRERPTVQPGQQESTLSIAMWLALAPVPILVTGLLVLLRLLRKTVNETRDSEQFRAALKIWTPLVAAKRHTPRSVKRFGNRMRYLAMLQQGEQNDDTQFDIIQRHIVRILNRQSAAPPLATTDVLAEQQMIAMGAIHELYGANWKRYVGATDIALQDPMRRIVDQAIAEHRQEFMTDWPPHASEILVFERLLSGVRLAGDPQVLTPSAQRRPVRRDGGIEETA